MKSPRNTRELLGTYAVCQVTYALEKMVNHGAPLTDDLVILNRQCAALHNLHHDAVDLGKASMDPLVEKCDRAVLALWKAHFGTDFPLKARHEINITVAEAMYAGLRDKGDPRRREHTASVHA